MKEVIRIDQQVKETEKPVEFTHVQDDKVGWRITELRPNDADKVIYLGKCEKDGDMFCGYRTGFIEIYKGHLNSGKY